MRAGADARLHPVVWLCPLVGCGKTTLLNALSGRLASTATLDGTVMVNGHKTRLSYGKSAYVTQDEMLIAMLTVRETILYAARLRLAGDMALHERVTDDVIADLGLTEVAHTYIGNIFVRGISGGQRKRVGIGCELVVSPTLLFLDEARVPLCRSPALACADARPLCSRRPAWTPPRLST